jgi:hypothetical protein
MWPWAIAGIFCFLPLALVLFLYRRAVAMVQTASAEREQLPPIDEVAALLQELQDAGEAIIARMESKQAEIDGLLRLLDAKLDAVQLGLQATAATKQPAERKACSPEEPRTLGNQKNERHEQVRILLGAGMDPLAISQKTGISLDEVRLIVSLLNSQASPSRR